MLKIVFLFCALGVPQSECTVHSAAHIAHGPDVANELQCLQMAQIVASQAARPLNDKEFMKVMCVRPSDVAQAPSREEEVH